MSIVPTLARRFLLSKVSDRFLSFIAWVSVVGVALGVLALTVVTSVINGFEGELTRVISGMNGDVVLYSRGDPVSEPEKIEEKIRKILPDTIAITDSMVMELMALGPNGTAGAFVEGVETATMGNVTTVSQHLISGRLPQSDGEAVLGSAIAERIGAQVGTEVRLILPFTGEDGSSAESGAPKVIAAKVTGIARMGMYEYDSKYIFTTLESAQKFLNQPGRVTTFKLKLPPGSDTRVASDRLADYFGFPFRAKDWSQLNRNLFYAIKLEKAVIAIILTVIVIVAAFNVVSTLMMMIHDKTKEIAILKAMGFRQDQGFGLFCLIGVGMGLVGTLVGITLGVGVNWVLRTTKLIDLPADIYFIGFLPVVVRWSEILWIGILALIVSFLATLYPAWKVSRRPPLEGLRYE